MINPVSAMIAIRVLGNNHQVVRGLLLGHAGIDVSKYKEPDRNPARFLFQYPMKNQGKNSILFYRDKMTLVSHRPDFSILYRSVAIFSFLLLLIFNLPEVAME
jgi:hypothetical protein